MLSRKGLAAYRQLRSHEAPVTRRCRQQPGLRGAAGALPARPGAGPAVPLTCTAAEGLVRAGSRSGDRTSSPGDALERRPRLLPLFFPGDAEREPGCTSP